MDKTQGVTLDDVANMMGAGFTELNGRIDHLEKRMDNFEGQIETLGEKIDIVNANVRV